MTDAMNEMRKAIEGELDQLQLSMQAKMLLKASTSELEAVSAKIGAAAGDNESVFQSSALEELKQEMAAHFKQQSKEQKAKIKQKLKKQEEE